MAKSNEIAVIEDGAVYILQPGTPIYVKTADVCAMMGCSNQWVGQLVSQGTLFRKKTNHGQMFNAFETMGKYAEIIKEKYDNGDDDEKTEKIRSKAEALLKSSKAKIAKLEADEREGKMHRSKDVAALTEDMVYTIRGALMALPGRLAVDVMSAKDSADAAEIIRKEIYAVMQELSEYEYDSSKYAARVAERLKKTVDEDDEEDG